MRVLRCMLLTLLLPGLLHAEPAGDEEEKEREAVRNRILWRLEEKDFEFAEKRCREVLADLKEGAPDQHAYHEVWVRYHLGKCLEAQGKTNAAIRVYSHVYLSHPEMIRFSIPAVEGRMRVLWNREKPNINEAAIDRHVAVEDGRAFLEDNAQLKANLAKGDLEEWARLEKLVQQYEKKLKEK